MRAARLSRQSPARGAYGSVFVAEPAANLVGRIMLEDDGTTLRARKAYEAASFSRRPTSGSGPVYLSNAPDGTLYIVDMYRGVIQDRSSTTIYLRDYIPKKKLDAPVGLGRIYRVVHETTQRDARASLTNDGADRSRAAAGASERMASRDGAAAASSSGGALKTGGADAS